MVKKRATPPNAATAYHEAGHAVMSIHLGRGVRSVELTPDHPEHNGVCRNRPLRASNYDEQPDWRKRRFVEREALILLAGRAAEAHFVGRKPCWSHQQDYRCAIDLALRVCGSMTETEAYLEWLIERAHSKITGDTLWPQVEAVAVRLCKASILSGAEVRKVCANALNSAAAGAC